MFYLEKGGRRQLELTCRTGRFDLALFVGREVGVIGPRRSPLGEVLGTRAVERIEVLGAARGSAARSGRWHRGQRVGVSGPHHPPKRRGAVAEEGGGTSR